MNIYRERMVNVVRALRDGNDCDFTMQFYGHTCGTPACALGHYASRADLQDEFKMLKGWLYTTDRTASLTNAVLDHFNINEAEFFRLFSSCGCGNAKTRDQAIAYIERFIECKWAPRAMEEPEHIEEPENFVMVGESEQRELEPA